MGAPGAQHEWQLHGASSDRVQQQVTSCRKVTEGTDVQPVARKLEVKQGNTEPLGRTKLKRSLKIRNAKLLREELLALNAATQCSHCGHCTKDCDILPLLKKQNIADQRVEAAKKKAEWEARNAEREKKAAEGEARRSEYEKKKAAEQEAQRADNKLKAAERELDVQSIAGSEVSTIASTTVDEKEVENRVMMDKEVRKLMKLLREIEKLAGRSDLDALQTAKLARKEEVELQLDGAQGLAKVRAKNELRKQVCS